MRRLIATYEMYVYDDGSVETVRKSDNTEQKIDTSDCSSSIKQIVAVLEYVAEYVSANPKSSRKNNIVTHNTSNNIQEMSSSDTEDGLNNTITGTASDIANNMTTQEATTSNQNVRIVGIRRCVTDGIHKVAADLGINYTSVHEKFTKKLNLTMAECKDRIENYFEGRPPIEESSGLEETLRHACAARTKHADAAAIELLINKLKIAVEKYNM